MSFYSNTEARTTSGGLDIAQIMRSVYLWMALGLFVGFGIAFTLRAAAASAIEVAMRTGAMPDFFLFNPVVMIILLVAYIAVGFLFHPIVMRSSPTVGAVVYLAFTAVFGVMTSAILMGYTDRAILLAFGTTAGMFGVMSVIGYTTKTDLSRFGSILFMGLIGIVIASLLNLLFRSEALYWVITYAAVLLFCALTAYDTQKIKNNAAQVALSGDGTMAQRVALLGAFELFLDFVNLFLYLLRIFGSRD